MRRNLQRFLGWGGAMLAVVTCSSSLMSQAAADPKATHIISDWSSHNVIFSKPATPEQAKRVEKDPRYWQQRYRNQSLLVTSPEEITNRRNHRLKRDWQESMGTNASVGAGNYPAKYSFAASIAHCGNAPQPDFVVYSTGLTGSSTQASIVAYDNLYSACSGIVPSVYWAYNTSGRILTSPVFSYDGTQVAFVQTNAAQQGTLVLLRWAASTTETIGNPRRPTVKDSGHYVGCMAPCLTTAVLKNSLGTPADDTTSSLFYDYSADTGYVGDSHGWLHKFTPLFNGRPKEITRGGWPVFVNSSNPSALSDPVHQYLGDVFVGDVGGYLYRVDPSGGVTASGQLDYGTGIVDSPMVDATAGLVYVFASSDGSTNCADGTACAAVYQLASNFIDGDSGTAVAVGQSVFYGMMLTPNPLYDGDFDSEYKNSLNATGSLYVCGNTGGNPTLYRVPIQAGVMGEVSVGPSLSGTSSDAVCSAVTDFLNPNATGGATEWIFVSTQGNGVPAACAHGGCVMNFKDTPWLPNTIYSNGQEVLDTNLHIEVVETGGRSGSSVPTWSGSTDGVTPDGSVQWLDQGALTTTTPAAWIKLHSYHIRGTLILDNNNNIEYVSTTGTSGGTIPTFNTTAGGPTTDGTVIWTNLGAIATAALPVAGGASGIIIDNFVGSGALAGASQVYFSTLGNQTCSTSGTSGGCAVQASQSALQ
jgi:hypothetical protein